MRTLQMRVLVRLLLLLGLLWLGLWAYAHYRAADTAAKDADTTLRSTAISLLIGTAQGAKAQSSDEDASISKAAANGVSVSARWRNLRAQMSDLPEFELTTLDNKLIARSPGFPSGADQQAATQPGFTDTSDERGQWRLFTVADEHQGVVCRVATPAAQQAARASMLSSEFTGPLFWAVPVLALLMWWGSRRVLMPLRNIARELDQRKAADLQPLSVDARAIPREVSGLVTALNDVFARLADALERQRTFVSAAGHELRTPLAGLKAQVQVARSADTTEAKDRAMAQILAALTRMERLVSQLLLLGRLNSSTRQAQDQQVDMLDIAERVMASNRDQAQDNSVSLILNTQSGLPRIFGNPDLVESMLGNLVENAIRHAPAASEVGVSLARKGDEIELSVTDHGLGIPKADREQVFDGFYRSAGKDGSSGLGLAIVRAVAQLHGGRVALNATAGGGTRASVHLPIGSAS